MVFAAPPPPAHTQVHQALPEWWKAFSSLSKLESDFTQTSESSVFGSLRKQGHLAVAKGGRLRVAYDKGLVLVSDGKRMVQYDPQARTAQALDLARALGEFPILNLLVDPRSLGASYEVTAEGEKIHLKPRRPGLPEVLAEGRAGLPTRITWKDGTGALQDLSLSNSKQPAALAESTFRFDPPKGTRWLGAKAK